MTMHELSKDTHSLSDFKRNTSKLVEQMEETGRPIVLTINGKAKLVVQNVASYQRMMETIEDAKTLRALLAAKAGKGRRAAEFLEELRQQYGFPEKRPKTKSHNSTE